MPKPTKLTPERHAKVLECTRFGMPLTHAASYAGVDVSTVERWIVKGERSGREPYKTFVRDLRHAQGEDMYRSLLVVAQAEKRGDWKAAAWKLSRRYPKQFGDRAMLHMTTGSDDPARQAYAAMSDEELEGEVAAALKRRSTGDDGNDSDSDDDEPASDGDPEDA